MDNISMQIVEENKKQSSSSVTFNKSPMEEKIANYLAKNKPCLYILTPCFASLCYVNYVYCLLRTKELFAKYGIELVIEFCKNDSLVSRARNNLVARAMSNSKMTHILFIDNDITWEPMDILKLLISDKQLVGGVYPLKHYEWKDLLVDKRNPQNKNVIQTWVDSKNNSQFKDLIPDEVLIQQKLLKYNINYMSTTLEIDNNLAKVKHLATGFMMIKRVVIESLQKAFPSTKYVDDVGYLHGDENNNAYALFDCGVEDGHYFSEDWLFCHRWTKIGGSIWIDVSINLTHTGIEDYNGSFITTII
jgi:hypothetical protein